MRLYELLQSHSSRDVDMAIYAQLSGARFTRNSKAIYDRSLKAKEDWNPQIGYSVYGFSDRDYAPNTWLEFFLNNASATKFLAAVDQGFNYQKLDTVSRERWQYTLTYAPSSHQFGYSKFLIPTELSALGYSLMAYIWLKDQEIYKSAYLEWGKREGPASTDLDQKRRCRGMAIDGLIDCLNRRIEADIYSCFPVVLP